MIQTTATDWLNYLFILVFIKQKYTEETWERDNLYPKT